MRASAEQDLQFVAHDGDDLGFGRKRIENRRADGFFAQRSDEFFDDFEIDVGF